MWPSAARCLRSWTVSSQHCSSVGAAISRSSTKNNGLWVVRKCHWGWSPNTQRSVFLIKHFGTHPILSSNHHPLISALLPKSLRLSLTCCSFSQFIYSNLFLIPHIFCLIPPLNPLLLATTPYPCWVTFSLSPYVFLGFYQWAAGRSRLKPQAPTPLAWWNKVALRPLPLLISSTPLILWWGSHSPNLFACDSRMCLRILVLSRCPELYYYYFFVVLLCILAILEAPGPLKIYFVLGKNKQTKLVFYWSKASHSSVKEKQSIITHFSHSSK